jgi:hypothetical protein
MLKNVWKDGSARLPLRQRGLGPGSQQIAVRLAFAQIKSLHLERRAYVYIRLSTSAQVHENVESKQDSTRWLSSVRIRMPAGIGGATATSVPGMDCKFRPQTGAKDAIRTDCPRGCYSERPLHLFRCACSALLHSH